MSDERLSRRRLLKGAIVGIAAVPAAALIARGAGAMTPLSESDPAAKSLGYVTDAKRVDAATSPTYKAGQTCANCIQYTGKPGAAEGGCPIFPNHTVRAAGWCKVWVAKPA
ncbi:MAG: high-potential iron-sulfur protein [Gammaproteobacteria bacterium]